MDEFINERFIDIILEEYPNVAETVLFEEESDALLFNAITIAQFPGMRIDLLIIREQDDQK